MSKWAHSVLEEDDFKAEWDAIELAAELRGDVCCYTSDDWFRSGCPAAPPSSSVCRRSKSLQVSFASHAIILVGNADDLAMKPFTLAVERLASWHEKPWSLDGDDEAADCAVGALWSAHSHHDLAGLATQAPSQNDLALVSAPQFGIDMTIVPSAVDDCSSWVLDIVDIFRVDLKLLSQALVPHLAFSTWFVNGTTQRFCLQPRIVSLGSNPAHWLAQLRALWCDWLDRDLGLQVGLVRPAPPSADGHCCEGHLILHQNTGCDMACLFSNVIHGDQEKPLLQFAQVCHAELTFDQVKRHCSAHSEFGICTDNAVVQTASLQVQHADPPFYVHHYDAVLLHVEFLGEFDDETSFMAAGPRIHALGPTQPPLMDDPRIAAQEVAQPDPEDDAPDDDGVSSTDSDDSAPRAWYPVTVFSLGQETGEGQANWRHHNVYRMNIARIMGLRDVDILQLYHVRWPPANLRSAGRQAIIVQKPGELPTGSNHKYVLIDVEFHPHRPSTVVEIVRAPYIVPDAFTRSNLLDFLGLSPFCRISSNRCLVWRNGQLVALQDLSQMQPEHGDFFRVVVPPTPELLQSVPTRAAARCAQLGMPLRNIHQYYIQHDVAADLHDMPMEAALVDEMALFQSSLRVQLGPFLTECRTLQDPVNENGDSWSSEETPRPARPAAPPVAPAFETELYHRWNSRVRRAQRDGPPLITTWYNDHDRWPICEAARDWQLHGPAETWRPQLLQLWHDRLDPAAPTEFFVVDPDPVDESVQIGAHVLLLQHAHPDARSILMSVLDSHIHSAAPRRWALRSSADPSGLELVALMGYRRLCPPADLASHCQVWCRRREIGLDEVVLVRHGLALTLTVLRSPPLAETASSDDTTMLQTILCILQGALTDPLLTWSLLFHVEGAKHMGRWLTPMDPHCGCLLPKQAQHPDVMIRSPDYLLH